MAAIPVFGRVVGALAVAPGFGLHAVPMRVRIAAAVVLTPAILPIAGPVRPDIAAPPVLIAATIEQLAIGLGLGFGASLFFYGVGIAGAFADRQLGLPFAVGFARPGSGQWGPLGAFYFVFATLVFFAIDGHHALLSGLARSFAALPVAGTVAADVVSERFCGLTGTLFVAALEVGAPVVAAVFIADVAIALASRAAPALQPLGVGLPVRCAVGLFAVALSLPLVVGAVQGYCRQLADALARLVSG